MQIYPAALIADEVGAPVYAVHTSAWQSVELIRDLKDRGWEVYGETIAAFLYWTAEEGDEKGLGTYGKIQPPIRRARDRSELWRGIRDGTITSVGTDCQMYTKESRHCDFWEARVGLGPGMGTMLPVLYTSGVLRGRCTSQDLARVLAENTARRFDLYPAKGALQVGSDADVIVLDPLEERVVHAHELQSAAGYSIYEGEALTGWPKLVFLRGELVARDGVAVGPPRGRHVPAS
jgi:dihydroorotase-like cyclic amidohydrolase